MPSRIFVSCRRYSNWFQPHKPQRRPISILWSYQGYNITAMSKICKTQEASGERVIIFPALLEMHRHSKIKCWNWKGFTKHKQESIINSCSIVFFPREPKWKNSLFSNIYNWIYFRTSQKYLYMSIKVKIMKNIRFEYCMLPKKYE